MKKNKLESIIFSSIVIKPIVSKEKDKYLSVASINELQKFLPDIDAEKNYDLLPISFNACVINRVNKNKDVITTATALEVYKTFINKPINLEHNRQKIIGCILTAGFTEFGTDKPLSEEEVKDYTKPFNIALGGLIWRTVNEDLANLIEECADPSSENFMKISASWELGYVDYDLVLIEGESKNIENGKLITDKMEVDKLKDHLIALGGKGIVGDSNVYRCPSEGVLAIGIGITENPAAEVQGIIVPSRMESPKDEEKISSSVSSISENNEINISQDQNEHVNNDRIDMKITSLKDITDENLKVVKASAITDFVEEEIKKIDTAYTNEKKNKETVEKSYQESIAESQAAKEELAKLKVEMENLKNLIASKQQEELFSARMAEFDSEYDLDDEDRQVIASSIKGLDDASFAAFKKNSNVFFKNRKKGAKKPAMEKEGSPMDKAEDKKEMKASAEIVAEVKKEDSSVISDALDKAKVEASSVPTTPPNETSLKDKWAKAFSPENVIVKKR